MNLTLPISTSQKYVRRDGEIVQPCAHPVRNDKVQVTSVRDTEPQSVYIETGLVKFGAHESPHDLVEDYALPAKVPGHPFAEHLRALADGRVLEHTVDGGKHWVPVGICADVVFRDLVKGETAFDEDFRVKPRTITINGRELSAPLRYPLKSGTVMHVVDLLGGKITPYSFLDSTTDRRFLDRGMCFATEQDAQAVMEAIDSVVNKPA